MPKLANDAIKERVAEINQAIRLLRGMKEFLLSIHSAELHDDGCEPGGT